MNKTLQTNKTRPQGKRISRQTLPREEKQKTNIYTAQRILYYETLTKENLSKGGKNAKGYKLHLRCTKELKKLQKNTPPENKQKAILQN